MNLAADFLSVDKQGWITTVIGIIAGIVVTHLYHRLQKTPKTLDYAISSTQDLTSNASPDLRERMEITWKEDDRASRYSDTPRILEEPRIVNYHIRNTGKRAIEAADFTNEIDIKAASGSIVAVIVTDVSREGVINSESIQLDFVPLAYFTPTLMNPKDWIEIQVITDGCPEPPELTTWFREESRPMQRRQSILYPPLWELLKRRPDILQRATILLLVFVGIILLILER
jgi:hypothetical protein